MVKVNPGTNCPDRVWSFVSKELEVLTIPYENPTERPACSVRIVCTSDTHCYTANFIPIPDGDIFIIAGDFTMNGLKNQVTKFNDWLGRLPHKYKIVIAGNHELTFDSSKNKKHEEMKQLLTNCIYLEDSEVTLYGLKIWGSPWQPVFGGWAFNINRGKDILEKWNKIPSDTDILITHGPPLGIGDLTRSNEHVGCVELLSTIRERLQDLKLHVFGHIHEAYGVYKTNELDTVFVNPSMCNVFYNQVNEPFVFDVEIPGETKKNST